MLTPEQVEEARKQFGITPSIKTSNVPVQDKVTELDMAWGITPTKPKGQKVVEKVAEFTGGKELAQGLGQAWAKPKIEKGIEETQKIQTDIQTNLLNRIKEQKESGADTTRLEEALKLITEDVLNTGSSAEKLLNPAELTPKKVIGSATQLATTAGGAKLAGAVVGKAGKATTLGKGAIEGAKAGAIGGATVGGLTGTAEALRQDKTGGEIAKGAIGGALIGAGTGGALGALTGGISGLLKGKKLTNEALNNHLETAKMQLENTPKETLEKAGGFNSLIKQNKENIVLQLESEGLLEKAKKVASVNTDKIDNFDEYAIAIKSSLDPKSVPKTEFVLDLVSPKATEAVKIQALKEGRVTEQGLLKAGKIKPSKRDVQLAEVVKEIVSPKNTAPKNLSLLENKVDEINTGVKAYVKLNKVPFNSNQLRTQLNKGKDDLKLVFASDKQAEKTYDAVVKAFMEHVKAKDTAGLLEARQSFDKIPAIKKLLDSQSLGENTRREVVLSTRSQANKYIASLLPKGNKYRDALLTESKMIEAIENIAEKNTDLIGTNKLQTLSKKYPILNWLAGGIGVGLVGGASIGVGRSIIGSSD